MNTSTGPEVVGTGLRTVEQIAGRMTTARAAMLGAVQGELPA
jgi:hypothetical protein